MRPIRERTDRLAVLVLVLVIAAFLAGSEAVHGRILGLIGRVEPVIALHPVWGAILFTGLAGLSALLVFVSSVVLVPVGVAAWGTRGCLLLLWTGWFLGSVVAYLIGRLLGRRVVERFVSAARLAALERRIPRSRSFWTAMLIQLVLQSDVAGYLFGLLAYPIAPYALAVLTAELMFAIVTVYLSAAFMRGEPVVLLAIAGVAAVVLLWRLRRRGRRGPEAGAGAAV